ncbi:MAG: DNA cytosine methyltransferase [Desulfovibrio sp.]|jgi:DNA (cytosine-5)-methyltransferase 1|nr:DNA cytosine methyltransferase [Desulfovibrio sp.]
MIAASRAMLAALAFGGLRHTGMVVDLFAGGGGASLGLEWAGFSVDLAINHDAEALAMHRANHPYATHLCCDIREVCPRIATGGREVDVLWASPDCKHHSRAKGGKPLERAIRALAWVVVRWVEETLPKLVCVENVCEFQEWGPLGPDDRPIKEHKGDYFRAWVRRLRRLGYRVEWRELVAADYGAPTSRRRLFVVARRDGMAVTWPEPTHGPGRAQPWRTAAECINWDDPAPSIFDRKKPLAPKTQARIAKGIKRYVLQAAKPFVVVNTTGHAPADLSAPMPTVTTGKQHMLVGPALVGVDQSGARSATWPAQGPLSTIVAKGKHALVTPVVQSDGAAAVWLAKHYGGVVGQPADKPLGTVTGVDHHGLVSASVLKLRGTNVGSEAQEPLHTISAQGQHHGLLCASISEFRTGAVGRAVDEPLSTITAGGTPKRPSTGNTKGLLCAHVQRYYSLGGQLSAADAPLPTATAKARFGLSTAVLEQYNTRSEPQPMDEPVPSVVSRDRFALVDMPMNAMDCDMGQDAAGRYAQVLAFLRLWGVIGPDEEAELVLDGVRCRIVDIGMRMLRPRELYRAQGFPDTYQIAPSHRGKHLSATSQVRMCGNSVPPHFSCALVTANHPAALAGREVAEAV